MGYPYPVADPGSAWGSSIVAVSRDIGKIDVWWIGRAALDLPATNPYLQHGYVYTNSFTDGQWKGKTRLGLVAASIRGGLAAVARDSNNMDVWWIGVDGRVFGQTWNSGNWQNAYRVSEPHSASTSGGLAAIARGSNSVEVFWIGETGTVEGNSLTFISQNQEPSKTPYNVAGGGSASNGLPSDGKI